MIIVYTERDWNLTVGSSIVEVIDPKNTFSEVIGTETVWSRFKREWKNWRLTIIIKNCLKNLLQTGAVAKMVCGVKELCFVLRFKKCMLLLVKTYMHTYIIYRAT